jgi:hypothetical protein
MNCREYRSQFSAYLDGDLSAEERHSLEVHLKECLPCYRQWSSFQRSVGLLRKLPDLEPPEHLTTRVIATANSRRFSRLPWFRAHPRRWLPLGVGIAALLAVSVALWRIMPTSLPRQQAHHGSLESKTTASIPPERSAAGRIASIPEYDSADPVVVLEVNDVARVNQQIAAVLRAFARSSLEERNNMDSFPSMNARMIRVQVPGQRLTHFIHELHKFGHLAQTPVSSQSTAEPYHQESVSVRIVLVAERQ